MNDLAECVIQKLQIDDGPGVLALAASGNDTKHPRWSPHNKEFITVFVATSALVNANPQYTIRIVNTQDPQHKHRREQGMQPKCETFVFREVGSAAVFSFAFLTEHSASAGNVKPCCNIVKAAGTHKVIGEDNVLTGDSLYSMTSVGRVDVASIEVMRDLLLTLNGMQLM